MKPVHGALALLLVCLLAAGLAPAAAAAQRTADAEATGPYWSWSRDVLPGFGSGSASSVAIPLVEFNGKLYAGVAASDGAQIWAKGAGGWSRETTGGFGDSDNAAIVRMQEYGGYLYAGTANIETGCNVYRTNGDGTWAPATTLGASPPGQGFGSKYNLAVTAMEVFNGELYVGLTNYILDQLPFVLKSEGTFIWKFNGSDWVRVDNDAFQEAEQRDIGIGDFEVYGGKLYASTIRAYYGLSFLSITEIKVDIKPDGCELWRTDGGPGYAWNKVVDNGFTNLDNMAAFCMKSYNGRLVIGTVNATASVIVDLSQMKITEFSVDSDGLYVYDYDGSTVRTLVSGGFGSTYDVAALCMDTVSYDGRTQLLVTTGNPMGVGKLEVYDGSKWSSWAHDGFDDPNNFAITGLEVRDEGGKQTIYAGTGNRETGCEVMKGQLGYCSWYLAEGTSNWGFDTYITIENPNAVQVTAKVTYMLQSGAKIRPNLTLPPKSQTVFNPREDLGAVDFSTQVECLNPGKYISVDRRMTWTGQGAASSEGHSSVGVLSPANTWYLAEGSSQWGFETWLLIQNPNATKATCKVTYMIEGAGPHTVEKQVPARSRATYNMFDDIGAKDAAIKVESNIPVIPERSMYRNNRREGHDSVGTTIPARDYYLAEGTTDWGFTTYVVVQNPNDEENTVEITYMTPEGPVPQAAFTMPANSRKTIRVNDSLPSKDLSTRVHGSEPLIAERAMYWDKGTGEACHESIGMPTPHTTFMLPDGETYNGMETWTMVQNPNSTSVKIEVSYLKPGGTGNVVFTDTVAANSRKTYAMGERIPAGRAAIMVRCTTSKKKIMVERAMYWNNRGAGTDTIGGYAD